MAKSGKVVQLFQKPENLIKQRARKLLLDKCFITPDWKDAGMANIVVSRRHSNGNFTCGFYLVDLKCLGIKDTMFMFNISEEEVFELVGNNNLEETDYITVHNIVYGAEVFADDFGLKPHKDWAITQFIMESDDENVPLMDIEFGDNGVPVYITGPNDTPDKINRILATLEKNAGKGNYEFYNGEEYINEDDDDDLLFKQGELHNIIEGKQEPNLEQRYFILKQLYRNNFKSDEGKIKIDQDILAEIEEEKVFYNIYSVDDDLEYRIVEFEDKYESILEDESAESISQLNALLEENPHNPSPYLELYIKFKRKGEIANAEAILTRATLLFPDFLYLRLLSAHADMIDKNIEKGYDKLNKQYYIHQAFPHRPEFTEGEFMLFYAALCKYFLITGDIESAISCGDLLNGTMDEYQCNESAIIDVCIAIDKKLNSTSN